MLLLLMNLLMKWNENAIVNENGFQRGFRLYLWKASLH